MLQKSFKCKTDLEKSVILETFEERNWTACQQDEDWNVYWALAGQVRNIFNPKTGYRLQDYQYINHFPNSQELTRKDLIVKNIKRYKRELEKEGNKQEAQQLDFLPLTYILPQDYSIFIEEFHKGKTTWIVKPSGASQGKGIFLLQKISQLKRLNGGAGLNAHLVQNKEVYVISKYLENPLLIGGKKFDLRLYVLVTSYKPLKIYKHDEGFARFCTEQYNNDLSDIDNMYVHLTNVAIQKQSDKYTSTHGGKWSLSNLKFYMEMVFGKTPSNYCLQQIDNICINSLKSVQQQIIQDRHCFELYGFDVLIDSDCKPWLIEVNVIPEQADEEVLRQGTFTCQLQRVGGFRLLYDEQLDGRRKKYPYNKFNFTKQSWK